MHLEPPLIVVSGVTLEEIKQYLRVNFGDDDLIIEAFLLSSQKTCLDILRTSSKKS